VESALEGVSRPIQMEPYAEASSDLFVLFEQVLLLDEITVDLDVLARADLMTFLKAECEERGATIIYATHIFDGLESWPTHMVSLVVINLQFWLSFLS
jgi:ABC-type thiamine transport system ATPase subunit